MDLAGALVQAARLLGRPLEILRGYRGRDLPADLAAGLTVGLVSIPQAIAFAAIAHLPPSAGLYSAAVAGIVGAMWGSSSRLVTGPSTAGSILLFSILAPLVPAGTPQFLAAASLMAVLVGLYRVGFALTGLGALVNVASRAVLLGFTTGIAALIGFGELRSLLRLPIDRTPAFAANLYEVVTHLGQTHAPSLAIGAATVALVLLLARVSRRLPGALIVLAGASVVASVLAGAGVGFETAGEVPRSLPSLSRFEIAALAESGVLGRLVTGGLALALLGLVEAVSIARAAAARSGERLDVDQELLGQGMANLATGLFSGYPCSGSFNRTAVNLEAGGRTPLAAAFAGVFILGAVLAFGPATRLLPLPAISGLLIVSAISLVDRRGIARVFRTSRSESAILVATLLATLVLPLEFAVLSGVILSLALYVYQSSQPTVVPVLPDPTFRHLVEASGQPGCPQLAVMSIRGALFFGAAQFVEDRLLEGLRDNAGQNLLLLRLHGVERCDVSGVEALERVVRAYRSAGGDVFLVRIRPAVERVLRRSGFLDLLGSDHILAQEEAIDRLFEDRLDPAVCIYECEERVFAECQALHKHAYGAELPATAAGRTLRHGRHLGVDEVAALLESEGERAVVLDVREPAEYRLGHLPSARLAPLRSLLDISSDLPPDRPLVLICRSGRRSTRAMHMLEDRGFVDLANLRGGVLSWKARGLPLVVD